jgi:hypothetical protein
MACRACRPANRPKWGGLPQPSPVLRARSAHWLWSLHLGTAGAWSVAHSPANERSRGRVLHKLHGITLAPLHQTSTGCTGEGGSMRKRWLTGSVEVFQVNGGGSAIGKGSGWFHSCRRVARGCGNAFKWNMVARLSGRRGSLERIKVAARSGRGLLVGCAGRRFLDQEMREDETVLRSDEGDQRCGGEGAHREI